MWLFTRHGFFSVVSARQGDGSHGRPVDTARVVVRARAREHLDALRARWPHHLGLCDIQSFAGTDYAFRMFVEKHAWSRVVSALVLETDYDNFKSAVARHQGGQGSSYVHALHRVWSVMHRFQESTGASTAHVIRESGLARLMPASSLNPEERLEGRESVWDGVTQATSLNDEPGRDRHALADAAKGSDWARVFDLLTKYPDWINSSRPDGRSLFAPLHQAAYGGAPREVVERLIDLGAWRTLQNARGERPVDVAERRQHAHLRDLLEPTVLHRVPLGVLLKVQSHFHAVIRSRADELVQKQALRLPELEPLLELADPVTWFPVPGMYGGFHYRLMRDGVEAALVVASWCRVAGGSGQRHEITSEGSRLVEEGFV